MIEFAAFLTPNGLRAWLLAGRAKKCLQRSDFTGAAQEFTRALELRPKWAAAYAHRAHAWLLLEHHAQAVDDCTTALSYDPRCAPAYNNRAVAYSWLERPAEASSDLDCAVQHSPRNVHYRANRGVLRARAGNVAGALDDLQNVLRRSPSHVRARVELARVYESLGKDGLALDHLDRAIRLHPAEATAYELRGNLHARRGRPAAAVRDFNRALRYGISPSNGLIERAQSLHVLGHDEAAIRDLEESIRLSPTFGALLVRSGIYLARGQNARAVADAKEALRLLGEGTKSDLRSLVYLRANDFEHALADCERLIENEPECGVYYNNRGYAWHQLGDFERAVADYEAAIRLSPDHPNAYKNLAALRANCARRTYRDGAKAITAAKRALELGGPKPQEWLGVVANAYAEAGDFASAEEWLRKSAEPPPPVMAPPFVAAASAPQKTGPFQFSLSETLLVLTVLAIVLTATRLLRDSQLWYMLIDMGADWTIGLMAIPLLFVGARHWWRQIRLRPAGERAFYLGVACGVPVGVFEGILSVMEFVDAYNQARSGLRGLSWSFLVFQTAATTFSPTCAYAALGGIIAVGLDHAIKRFRGVQKLKSVVVD